MKKVPELRLRPSKSPNVRCFDRRGWLAAALRGGALMILVLGSALLLGRGGRAQDCGRQVPCQRCGLASRCLLPRAVESRRDSRNKQ
jgi:hypothetical protein